MNSIREADGSKSWPIGDHPISGVEGRNLRMQEAAAAMLSDAIRQQATNYVTALLDFESDISSICALRRSVQKTALV